MPTPRRPSGKLSVLAVAFAALVGPCAAAEQVTIGGTAITLDQAADIYAGQTLVWPDGSQIPLALRQSTDTDTTQVKRISARLDQALSDAEKRPGMPADEA